MPAREMSDVCLDMIVSLSVVTVRWPRMQLLSVPEAGGLGLSVAVLATQS